MLILPPGRDWRLEAQAVALSGAHNLLIITQAAGYPLLVRSYSVGNGSAPTSGQARTVWSKATAVTLAAGTDILAQVQAVDGGGGAPQFTVANVLGTGLTFGTEYSWNKDLRDWPSIHGIEYRAERDGGAIWLPAFGTTTTWALRLIAAPASTNFSADIEVIVREVAA